MSFDDDARPELAPVPLIVAATRGQRARWIARAQAQGLDLHQWMVEALEREAGELTTRRMVGAERGRT